jgi:hypothetical protein
MNNHYQPLLAPVGQLWKGQNLFIKRAAWPCRMLGPGAGPGEKEVACPSVNHSTSYRVMVNLR